MKPSLDIKHEGTMTGERRRMSIRPEDFTHLMGVVTDLYSDRPLAVIREISTNALDSHVAAGVNEPILVSLPNVMSQVFIVQDFGLGMSMEEIFNNFGMYGASTKRDDDTAVGMLGLGCKAPLSYTSQFTLVSVKNGVKITALVTREEDGAGAIQVLDTVSTDDRNGVTIKVPVYAYETFSQRAREFFRCSEPGTVLVDMAEPDHYGSDEADLILDPDVILSSRLDSDVIVMGGVPYPLPFYDVEPLVASRNTNIYAMVRVPIGTINFTPSREALMMTERTNEAIHEARTFISGAIRRTAQAAIDACPTASAAMREAARWRTAYKGDYRYEGVQVPMHIDLCRNSFTFRWNLAANPNPANKLHNKYLSLDEALDAVHVFGAAVGGISRQTKDRLRIYLSNQENPEPVVFFHAEKVGQPWLDDSTWIDYKDLSKIALPKATNPKAPTPKFRRYSGNGVYSHEVTVDPTRPILYLFAKDALSKVSLRWVPNQYQVIVIPKPYELRFKKDYPTALHVGVYVEKALRGFVATLTPDERYGMVYGRELRTSGLMNLSVEKILDPELRAFIIRFKPYTNDGLRVKWEQMTNSGRDLKVSIPSLPPPPSAPDQLVDRMTMRYGLASDLTHRDREQDVLDYVNAIYIYKNQLHLNPIV